MGEEGRRGEESVCVRRVDDEKPLQTESSRASGAPEASAGLNSVSSSSAAAASIAKFDNSTNWTLCCRRGRRCSCTADDCLFLGR